MQEYKGIIHQLFNSESGIIVDENDQEYYFSKVNFDENVEIKIGDKVLFDCIIIKTQNEYSIYKAINIEKI